MAYRKSDVTFHSDGFRDRRPAVNVKHHPDFGKDVDWDEFGGKETAFYDWLGMTPGPFLTAGPIGKLEEWWNTAWEVACEQCWDDVEELAQDVFRERAPQGNAYVKVWSQGRQGGWAVVDGIKDFDSWDAVDLNAWYRFERDAKIIASDVGYRMIWFLYYNIWESEREALNTSALASAGVS